VQYTYYHFKNCSEAEKTRLGISRQGKTSKVVSNLHFKDNFVSLYYEA